MQLQTNLAAEYAIHTMMLTVVLNQWLLSTAPAEILLQLYSTQMFW
jgi:hypothetical protein